MKYKCRSKREVHSDTGLSQETRKISGNSLVVQWLKLCAQDIGGLGLIPGQGTSSHVPQLRLYAAK